MKKLCVSLATIAVLGAFGAQADKASGHAPVVDIAGKITGYGVSDTQTHRNKGADSTALGLKGDLSFRVMGMLGNTEYGGVVTFDARRDKTASRDLLKNAYVYIADKTYGTLQLGDLDGVTKQGMVSGIDVMGGTGGFYGDMWYVANPTSGVMVRFEPMSYTKYATKLVYKSPEMFGLQLMMSYTPHSELYGTLDRTTEGEFDSQAGRNKSTKLHLKRQFSLGLSYNMAIADAAVSVYAVGSIAKPDAPAAMVGSFNHIKTYELGMFVDWCRFQFGAGFIDNQKSALKTTTHGDAGKAYNAAVSYTFGPNSIAVGYLGSQRKVVGGKARAHVASATYERQVAPGWTVFGEANYFKTTNTAQYRATLSGVKVTDQQNGALFASGTRNNNKGGVFLLGTTVRF